MSNSETHGSPSDTRQGRGTGRTAGSSEDLPDFARLFVEEADEWISCIDSEARFRFVNPALCSALGYSAAELASLRIWDLSPTTAESWPQLWSEIQQGLSRSVEAELRTRAGGIVQAHFHLKHVTLDATEYLLCCGRERATTPERAALAGEPRPMEPAADVSLILNKGRVVDSSRRGEELFGCPSSQIVEELEETLRESGRIVSALSGKDFTFGWQSRRPDGSPFQIECTVSRVQIEGHVRLLAIAVDATVRRNSERTLAQLSGRLLEMQDEERRRIARELHDTTGQNLGAVSIHLSMMLSTCSLDAHARETLGECIALTDASMREIRTLSYLLHPPLLDELGLVSALRAYCEGYAERTGLGVDLDLPDDMPRLPQAVEIALFRIVQEGLTNIHRHSGSPTATLRLKYHRDKVELEIADHGRGLPLGTLEGEVTSASRIGVGIAGMRERARQLGGRLTIGSSETGTTLHVVLPLVPEAAHD